MLRSVSFWILFPKLAGVHVAGQRWKTQRDRFVSWLPWRPTTGFGAECRPDVTLALLEFQQLRVWPMPFVFSLAASSLGLRLIGVSPVQKRAGASWAGGDTEARPIVASPFLFSPSTQPKLSLGGTSHKKGTPIRFWEGRAWAAWGPVGCPNFLKYLFLFIFHPTFLQWRPIQHTNVQKEIPTKD